jgi:steroid 5-alpha reductase family enzyme
MDAPGRSSRYDSEPADCIQIRRNGVIGMKGQCARVAMMVLMCVAALALQRRTGNAGWVDAVWSAATGFVGALCALAPQPGGNATRHVLVAAMAAFWSGRLAWHIATRTLGAPEDARYAAFRQEWGGDFQRRLFWFLMIQAAAAWVLVLAITLAARNPAPLRAADLLGLVLLLASVGGEALADRQLRQFRRRGRGPICDTGLWGWSRHPNYFFEFLGWCAYPLIAIDGTGRYPAGALALIGPAFMFWLLRYVSGVPPLEKSMLARRGDAFRAYQRRVSAFIPLPPTRPPP